MVLTREVPEWCNYGRFSSVHSVFRMFTISVHQGIKALANSNFQRSSSTEISPVLPSSLYGIAIFHWSVKTKSWHSRPICEDSARFPFDRRCRVTKTRGLRLRFGGCGSLRTGRLNAMTNNGYVCRMLAKPRRERCHWASYHLLTLSADSRICGWLNRGLPAPLHSRPCELSLSHSSTGCMSASQKLL